MKKIIYITILLIILPSLTILILSPLKKTQKENKYEIEKNKTVRVLRSETNKVETITIEQYLIGVI